MAPHNLRPGDYLTYTRETVSLVSGPRLNPETGKTYREVTCESGRVLIRNEGEVSWVQRPSQTR